MKITTLFENRTISEKFKKGHGLSLYIETHKHKILFDTGTSSTFADNAVKLGVKLEDVDVAIISHGHFDHGGGLETFLKLNKSAKIYIGKGAFDKHLGKLFGLFKFNVGLKKELSSSDRLVFIDSILRIDDELCLFNGVKGNKLPPKGNKNLLKEFPNRKIMLDDFEHEINLIVNENEIYTLFSACSHKGVVNIINRAKEILNRSIDTVIGGFHLVGMNGKNSKTFLDELSKELKDNKTGSYYTCHCTGEVAFNYLRENMDNMNEIKTGMTIEV